MEVGLYPETKSEWELNFRVEQNFARERFRLERWSELFCWRIGERILACLRGVDDSLKWNIKAI